MGLFNFSTITFSVLVNPLPQNFETFLVDFLGILLLNFKILFLGFKISFGASGIF